MTDVKVCWVLQAHPLSRLPATLHAGQKLTWGWGVSPPSLSQGGGDGSGAAARGGCLRGVPSSGLSNPAAQDASSRCPRGLLAGGAAGEGPAGAACTRAARRMAGSCGHRGLHEVQGRQAVRPPGAVKHEQHVNKS